MAERETLNHELFYYINLLYILCRINMKHCEPDRNHRSFVS